MKLIAALTAALIIALLSGSAMALAQDNSDASSGQGAEIVNRNVLIPDCLRQAEQVRVAGADCVVKAVTFYTNLLLFVVAVASLFYMLYGAFLYASAFGDENKIGLAKKTITYAIVGIILAGASAILVQLVKSVLNA
ncbi:MAG: hypothetical protein WEC83_00970 [Patescibacteria group bacterium]